MINMLPYRPLFTNATTGLFCSALLSGAQAAQHEVGVAPKWTHLVLEFHDASRGQLATPLMGVYVLGPGFELSDQAHMALGDDGRKRVSEFRHLGAGWDGRDAKALNPESLKAFSEFFRDTALAPAGLAVFMSRDGNIAVNWMDQNHNLVELEFAADQVRYFFESTGDESAVARTDVGTSKLYKALSSSHA